MRTRTVVAQGALAMKDLRLELARERAQGARIMTFERLAARLAGGLLEPIDADALRSAVQSVLQSTELGELDNIKALPGTVSSAAWALQKAWLAGIDLSARSTQHPRLDAMARLERAVLAALPRSMLRPADLAARASRRLRFADRLFGAIDIVGLTELSPCWRPLLLDLAIHVPVRWIAGARSVPAWLDDASIDIARCNACTPRQNVVSNANPHHEALEAMRWARALIASGRAAPEEIAIASAGTAEYDDSFVALREAADFDIHFVHGVPVTTTPDGQAAAALADILLRGLSQIRTRRLIALLDLRRGPLKGFPAQWTRILPADVPLSSVDAWNRLLDRLTPANWPDHVDRSEPLRSAIALLARGTEAAREIGETLLCGNALTIWRKALLAGAAASLDTTLVELRQDDAFDACTSVGWMPAHELAAAPRRYVRLLGLNSSAWPRPISEDRLLPDHIVARAELDPLPIAAADRRDFATILHTTSDEVVLSFARRDRQGRLLGRSPLLHGAPTETYVRGHAPPAHAMSDVDRLFGRPDEIVEQPQCKSAIDCWRDWHRIEITPHDGSIRSEHPLLVETLRQLQSARSLRLLLRNPLGYVWRYALGWRAPEEAARPLVVDASAFGKLVHGVLDRAVQSLEAAGGTSACDSIDSDAASDEILDEAVSRTADAWVATHAIPPALVWRATLEQVREAARRALAHGGAEPPGLRRFTEVPFGGNEAPSDKPIPWDPRSIVEIPGTDLRISGYLDRIDISSDGRHAHVLDYKTGKPPKPSIVIDGGKELQCCLYACAVRSLLGSGVAVTASLLYPMHALEIPLAEPDATLTALSSYLRLACDSLCAGHGLPGPDAADEHDESIFALPANAAAGYRARKRAAARDRLSAAADVWGAP